MRTLLKSKYRIFIAKRAVSINKSKKIKLPNSIERVYHVHIRKSAGTSINAAFWGLGGLNLKKLKREPLKIGSKHLVFVRNNVKFIEEGNYFFANSHIPIWNLNLPENTFTFCVLRDPYERLVSLYKYYIWVSKTPKKEALKVEPYYNSLIKHTHWLGNTFSDFLDNIPKKNIANQLFMFSEKYNVKEAHKNINRLNKIYFQDNFKEAITDLSEKLDITLKVKRERNFGKISYSISKEEKQKAMFLLKDEYLFYNLVKLESK